jgi:DNA-binding PadR family transcriptional regulator
MYKEFAEDAAHHFPRHLQHEARKHRRHHHDPEDFGAGWKFGHRQFGPHGFGPKMGRDFWRFFGGSGWGGRMRRGDVRAAILALLNEGPQNGYGIIQEIERRSEGLWKPSAGAVYPALQQLEDEGLIEQFDGAGRKQYRLTEAGKAYVAEHAEEVSAPWASMSNGPDESVMGLLGLVRQVGMAAVQVSQAGTASQIAEARTILADARRKLYGILASEEPEAVEL